MQLSDPSCSEKSTTSKVPGCPTAHVVAHGSVPMAAARRHGARPDNPALSVTDIGLEHVLEEVGLGSVWP